MNKKTIIITGGNSGIGKTIADLFSQKGYKVAVSSRSPRNRELSKEILHFQMDVRNREEHDQFVVFALKHFGGLNVFINCAGISRWRAIEKIEEDFVGEVIETNLLGTLWGCATASKVLPPGGVIVNVSSLAGKRGSANNSAYCASKFAVNGITQSLAKELGPKGIRVNAVCPVYVETDYILNSLHEKDSPTEGGNVHEYLKDFIQSQAALKRLPTAKEVAQVVHFLASEEASAITGQCINVDCGVLPQ